ncbi:LRR receptor-like serine/threonine-protein kinase [Tripterygium wilfordii]|uniref:LRR receptor-like serine/threonine-protein kinase n=1 Tax=Tripterygium wilfordii TaxID=458696 RepID=A0A7J7CM98_TRIWF|nr:receptor-like protein 13 [Tripterygium wilfordii]KAF5735141.1 LRR receptor-like serine/threonine-protein kinase [Tripterygium wilfordii]
MFSGEIPHQLTATGSRLVYLNLSNNRLRGEMLPRDSNMTDLECLQISGNNFRGVISPAISRSPSLVILDIRNNYLSGNIPSWLYNHPHLVAVLLGGNNFEGHIRRQLCRMKTLQVLDISKNHLRGGIPSCLDNITFWKQSPPDDTNYFTQNGRLYFLLNPSGKPTLDFEIGTDFLTKNVLYSFKGLPLTLMTGINLSWNKLTGYIPSELGELSQLRSLNLSNNLLTGNIPTSFQNLKSMESLDLSRNNLSGDIPYPMAKLSSLSSFSVAYNNLSGRIPSDGQFSTFDMNSFIGNPLFCGDPLPQICSTTNPLEPQDKDQEKEDSIFQSNLFFYGFVAVSYAFGLWVSFGILILNRRWRQTYFRAIDRYILSFFGQK